MDVLNFHGCFIDQHSDGEGESADGHDVDCLASQPQGDCRGEQGEGDVENHDQRRAPVAQEKQHHQTGQRGAEGRFGDQTANRVGDVDRLIEFEPDIDVIRYGFLEVGQGGFDGVDDGHR